MYPLSNIVWVCILATMTMTVLAKLLTMKDKSDIFGTVWASGAVFFGGDFNTNESQRKAFKILTLLTLFGGNIIWMGYQASLTVELSAPISKLPFTDLDSLSNTDWKLYTAR